jgi:hypothetical protein
MTQYSHKNAKKPIHPNKNKSNKARRPSKTKAKKINDSRHMYLVEDQRAQQLHLVLLFARKEVAQTREQHILVQLGDGATARIETLKAMARKETRCENGNEKQVK